MRRDYLALWGILAAAFLIFLTMSMCGDISLGSVTLKASGLADALTGSRTPAVEPAPVDTATCPADTCDQGGGRFVLPDSANTVLIIGDSMLEGLAPRLAAYCSASADTLYSVIWYSSTSELYGKSALLTDYMATLHPDYVIISLGGNELFVKDIAQKRDKYVKAIVAELGDTPFLWIGPPNWRPDTGINDLIAENVPEGCFFLSDGMDFDRSADGAHPTQASAAAWMDSIVRWMPRHARYHLPLNQPERQSVRPARQFMHQPGPLTHRPR